MYHPIKYCFDNFDNFYNVLQTELEKGNIRRAVYNGLEQYTYTEDTIFNKNWTPHTLCCRGIILDPVAKRIVAIPFPKFFNLGECDTYLTNEELNSSVAYEKYDGSCIIMYYYNGKWNFNTKGSFQSDQAIAAANWMQPKIATYENMLDTNVTYLFEWVGKDNRIVLTYPEEELILIGAFNNITFEDYDIENIAWSNKTKVATSKPITMDFLQEYVKNVTDHEGFVIKTPYKRVKIKTEWYIAAHKIVSDFSPRRVFEEVFIPTLQTSNPEIITSFQKSMPEEFEEDFLRYYNDFVNQYTLINENRLALADSVNSWSDKEVGI